MEEKRSAFTELLKINVNEHTEKKKTGNAELTYLSWPWCISEVKKRYPDANYEIERFNGLPYVYDPMTGYMVFTKATIEGVTHEMWLPVMDGANNAMKAEPYEIKRKYGTTYVAAATMFDINKTIMRCLVKNFAMHGLGLYIYAGEDLPEQEDGKNADATPEEAKAMEESNSQPINATAWKSLVAELKEAGLDAKMVIGYYGYELPSQITWDALQKIRGEKKSLMKIEELRLGGAK